MYIPVKHIFDPVTGESLGTVPVDDMVTGLVLVREAAARRANPRLFEPQPRRLDAREKALADQANMALAMPFEMSIAGSANALQVIARQATRVIAAPRRAFIEVPPENYWDREPSPYPKGYRLVPGFCDTCGASPGRCGCKR
jgi:hypothetical protein